MAEALFQRFGHHYILVMMILTRLAGTVGGLLVIYYVELTLDLPAQIRAHFRISSLVVVVFSCSVTVIAALFETRVLREALRRMRTGEPLDDRIAALGGEEAVVFVGRHHRLEAWLVPLTTLVPVLIFLKVVDDASMMVMVNITIAVFMGIAMALMSTYFAVNHCMQPVIHCFLARGVQLDYDKLPAAQLQLRFALCSILIIVTTALMIGTLARQRASDIVNESDPTRSAAALAELKSHTIYITVAAVVTGVFFSSLLTSSVTTRIRQLVSAMERVGSGRLSQRVRATGTDEVDRLARQFNAMIGELERNDHTIRDLNHNLENKVQDRTRQLESALANLRDAQTRLTDMAHSAGMAEIATGVLHNVGNVLNSVNISAAMVGERVRGSRLADLERTLERLSSQRDDLATFLADGRGAKLIDYLSTISTRLKEEREDVLREVGLLEQKIGHIKSVIAAQQNYARRITYREDVEVAKLVDDVLSMHAPSFARHNIRVERDYEPLPKAHLEKNKLVQIVDNLVKNARESIRDFKGPERKLVVRIAQPQPQPDRAAIVVEDSGGGIAADVLKRIFQYG
ncbi:MAG: HAMP domain-containing protein, partial [Planctomycetes bacterium]|nr:HAMP domain-containing protein [Planctomycetota bacterium]